MAEWKPGDVVAVQAEVTEDDGRLWLVFGDGDTLPLNSCAISSWPDAERLASLQAERDSAQRLADLHMNAASVYQREIATLEAQLALRDAVVEAARDVAATHGEREWLRLSEALADLGASENPR